MQINVRNDVWHRFIKRRHFECHDALGAHLVVRRVAIAVPAILLACRTSARTGRLSARQSWPTLKLILEGRMRVITSMIALAAALTAGGITVDGVAAQQVAGSASAVELPGTNHVVAPSAFPGPGREQSLIDLQNAIGDWLAFEFGLPKTLEQATVAFASPSRMAGLRFRDLSSDQWPNERSEILAVYDDDAKTIYLPEGWTGGTAAELSVLVHETVHHLQNVDRQKFACPEEREKMAYEAQERWLKLFSGSLEADFQLDPFTVLVRTTCHY